jgi:hypothetical protein
MITSSAPRGFIALCLAAVIAFGMLAGLTWEEWQLIGWAVILGGGALALTANGRQNEVLAAAAPALTFFAGFTFFYWKLPVWQAVDIASIGCFLAVAYMNFSADRLARQ